MLLLLASSESAGEWLLWIMEGALKAAMLVAVVAATTLLLRRSAARLRVLMWSLAFSGVLAMPLLSRAAPDWQVPLLPSPDFTSAKDETAGEAAPSPAVALVPANQLEPPMTPSQTEPPAGSASAAASLLDRIKEHWVAMVVGLWFAGLITSFTWWTIGFIRAAMFTRRARRLTDESWLSVLEESLALVGLNRPVRLLQSSDLEVPMTWGAFRPVVLVPDSANEWSRDRRRMVLLHELVHVRRYDWLIQTAAFVASALYWFNPLMWAAWRRLGIERERACDEGVIATGTKPSEYAAHLVDIARSLSRSSRAPCVALAMARPSQLKGRLMSILKNPGPRRCSAVSVLPLILALALISTTIAAARPWRPVPKDAEPEPTLTAEEHAQLLLAVGELLEPVEGSEPLPPGVRAYVTCDPDREGGIRILYSAGVPAGESSVHVPLPQEGGHIGVLELEGEDGTWTTLDPESAAFNVWVNEEGTYVQHVPTPAPVASLGYVTAPAALGAYEWVTKEAAEAAEDVVAVGVAANVASLAPILNGVPMIGGPLVAAAPVPVPAPGIPAEPMETSVEIGVTAEPGKLQHIYVDPAPGALPLIRQRFAPPVQELEFEPVEGELPPQSTIAISGVAVDGVTMAPLAELSDAVLVLEGEGEGETAGVLYQIVPSDGQNVQAGIGAGELHMIVEWVGEEGASFTLRQLNMTEGEAPPEEAPEQTPTAEPETSASEGESAKALGWIARPSKETTWIYKTPGTKPHVVTGKAPKPVRAPKPWGTKAPPSPDAYVKRFIKQHQLTPSQKNAANSILKDMNRKVGILHKSGKAQALKVKVIQAREAKLFAEMKRRLDGLLTTSQRRKAQQNSQQKPL